MLCLTGISASPGRALGRVMRLRQQPRAHKRFVRALRSAEEELASFEAAVQMAMEELAVLEKCVPKSERDVLRVQRVILTDEGLLQEVHRVMADGLSANAAIESAAQLFAGMLRRLPDCYMAARACDVLDVCNRVAEILEGVPRHLPCVQEPVILAAEEIYPTDLVCINGTYLRGFLSAQGSVHAHAAILARTMGLPAVVGVGAGFLADCEGATLALDGDVGKAVLRPDDLTQARFAQAM